MKAINNKLVFLFITAVIVVIGICYLITKSSYYFSNADVFSLSITIDIVFFIPLMYILFIRKRDVSKITVIPVIILSYITASFLLPSIDHAYLKIAKMLIAPIELFAVCFIIYKIRLAKRQYNSLAVGNNDFLKNVHKSLNNTLGENKVNVLLATEISVLYYGIFGWKSEIEIDKGKAFSYYKKSGYSAVVAVFVFLTIIETFSLHLLIAHWSAVVAWVLTILSIYGLIFLLADFNSARKRPIYINDYNLEIRIGFRWNVTIPFENIKHINICNSWISRRMVWTWKEKK